MMWKNLLWWALVDSSQTLVSGEKADSGFAELTDSVLPYPEHLAPTGCAHTLSRWFAILHGYSLGDFSGKLSLLNFSLRNDTLTTHSLALRPLACRFGNVFRFATLPIIQ